MEHEDAQLIEAYLAGDEAALVALVARHIGVVYRFVARIVGPADADDVTQETFVKAWRHLKRFKPTGKFRTWLLAIAHNTAIDRLRKRHDISFSSLDSEYETFEETVSDDAPLPDEVMARGDTIAHLEEALERLSPQYKEVVLLHDMEELTFEEIAATLEKPMNTVKSQYRRAIAELRKYLMP